MTPLDTPATPDRHFRETAPIYEALWMQTVLDELIGGEA